MEKTEKKNKEMLDWIVIGLLVSFILVKGFYTFFWVGDLGQPTWDYRPVRDVPGESSYAVYELLPYPQHIRGEKGE